MVDTTISAPAEIKPPFRDMPLDTTGVFSQPWNGYLVDTSDRVAAMWQQLSTIWTGVTDGSDAAAGQIGEYLSASVGNVGLVSGVTTNLVSIDLTAGDWDVGGNVHLSATTGTHDFFGTGIDEIDTFLTLTQSNLANQGLNPMQRRFSLTATTTAWLQAVMTSTGDPTASGVIWARRVR